MALGRAERLSYRSKDGTLVEGWLIPPHGYRANGGPYPLVVNNHGGPHSAVGYSFDFKNQFLAANGYFVLTVNFRSSTGYGEKFLWGTWGAWGDRDGEDVMAGIDHVIGHYPVDRNRVATIGHSYGGFMSNWLIVQYPERFAAAAVGAGIVNWSATTDCGHRPHQGDRVLRHALGGGGAEHDDPPVAAHVRGTGARRRCSFTAKWTSGSRTPGGADVRGAEEERRPGEGDPVPGCRTASADRGTTSTG